MIHIPTNIYLIAKKSSDFGQFNNLLVNLILSLCDTNYLNYYHESENTTRLWWNFFFDESFYEFNT